MVSAKEKPVVLIVSTVFNRASEFFNSVTDMQILPAPIEERELADVVAKEDPDAVVLNVDPYTGPLYHAMKTGGLIARYGVGYDGVDIEQAEQNKLLVTNTPGVLEATVAEFTVFLVGEVLRKAGSCSSNMKRGHWNPHMGNELNGKTWAILGLGNIGKKLSRILSFGFGVEVLGLKRSIDNSSFLEKEYGVQNVSTKFSDIAPRADIVSLLLPANKDTYHYMNRSRLQQLKPGSILINTGRGALVDEEALYDVLYSGHLSAAGLDVFQHEPYEPVNPQKDLRSLDNVVLTPHMGSSAVECSRRMAQRVIQNIRFSIGGKYNKMDLVSSNPFK